METSARIDEFGRPEPPIAADEQSTLLGFLEYQRATFAWKTAGLDAGGLNTRVAASSMTLGGMLKHLAFVESYWLTYQLHGGDPGAPWNEVDWESDPDWDWNSAAEDSPEQLRSMWRNAVSVANDRISEALAEGGMDHLAARQFDEYDSPSLRWIVIHMIEEYARHNGHADLIRESIDGETGE
jgi:uncharacterized damage-inducible protein DinB